MPMIAAMTIGMIRLSPSEKKPQTLLYCTNLSHRLKSTARKDVVTISFSCNSFAKAFHTRY
jgi:hypothetical protein